MSSRPHFAPVSRCLLLAVFLATLLAGAFALAHEASAINMILRWTAPGDDSTFGRASEYDLRYSIRASQFPSRFSTATRVPTPLPSEAGTMEELVVADMPESTTVYFALRTRDEFGNWSMISNVLGSYPIVGVDGQVQRIDFSEPRPSPASSHTRFTLSLPRKASASVEAIDVTGRRVRLIQRGELAAGQHTMEWDLRDEAGNRTRPGVFFIRARTGDEDFLRRVVVLR